MLIMIITTNAVATYYTGLQEPFRFKEPTSVIGNTLDLHLNLTRPSVAVVHVCAPGNPPGRVTHLRVYNVTYNEVVLFWKSRKVKSK